MATKKSAKSEICKCKNCKKPKSPTQIYKGTELCKTCVNILAVDPKTKKITHEGVKKVMQLMDKPMVEDLFVRVANDEKTTNLNFVGNYLKQINLTKEYRDATFIDSNVINMKNDKMMNAKSNIDEEIKKEEKAKEEVTDDMRFFWTSGLVDLPDREILILQKKYDQYTNNSDLTIVTSKKIQDDFKALVKYELQKGKIEYNLEEVKTVQMLQKMIDDLSESLGISAIQKQSKFDSGKFTLGLIARYRELTKPIPRWEEDYGNYNSMKALIKTHYLGGMGISMGLSSPEIEKSKEKLKEFEVNMEFNEEQEE